MSDKYQCDNCGACCKSLIIEIDHIDVVREPRLLPLVKLLDGNGTISYDDDFEKQYLLAAYKPCPMLGVDNLCQCYISRPNVCVAMQAGGEQCQDARERMGLGELLPMEQVK